MKIKGKIANLLAILSISYSAAASVPTPDTVDIATCPAVEDINQEPRFLVDGAQLFLPSLGRVRVEVYIDEFPILSYVKFQEAIIQGDYLYCTYIATSVHENPFLPLVFLINKSFWKPVNPYLWPGNKCTASRIDCAVKNQ